jgi:cytochrome P450
MTSLVKYNLNSREFRQNAHEILARLRKQGPIFKGGLLDGRPSWYVLNYALAETVLRDNERFVLDYRIAFGLPETQVADSAPGLMDMVNNHLLTKEGEDHRRLRALVSKAFTPRRIADLRPRIQAIADELLDQVFDQGEMDLVDSYAFPLPITVIAELLGIPAQDRSRFRQWSDDFVSDDGGRFFRASENFVGYLQGLFEQRRGSPGDDLITALLQAEEAGERLSTPELFSMVVLLIVAGHETTVTLIGNGAVTLLSHPEALAHLKQHPEEMPRAVEEILRFESPVERALPRWVARDTELGGRQLRQGDVVVVVLGSANRDEQQFPAADQLDPARDPNPHLGFGRGPHYCLGAPLARLEGEIALNTLLQRLPNPRLLLPRSELERREVMLFNAFERIPIAWNT